MALTHIVSDSYNNPVSAFIMPLGDEKMEAQQGLCYPPKTVKLIHHGAGIVLEIREQGLGQGSRHGHRTVRFTSYFKFCFFSMLYKK